MKKIGYFSKLEIILWSCSVLLIVAAFILFDKANYLTLAASVIGVTSLIFNAKGNPVGQILMIVFSVLYGVISFSFAYYGEMITYLGMTMPMAVVALISWLRHPYRGKRSVVAVNKLTKKETVWMFLLTAAVTGSLYFVLQFFHTANIIPSTISVFTSFLAVYLTFRRSAYFSLAYAANDVVLIVLWAIASAADHSYLSVVICFFVFLINDLYAFACWLNMRKRQSPGAEN